jgi:hypothetical protein
MAGPYYYTPLGYLWAQIQTLRTGDTATQQNLWKEGLHRIYDYAAGVYDSVLAVRAELASQAAATPALLRGSVLLGNITYYDPINTPTGSLDWKTLILEWDGAGAATVTFATPQSPAEAIAAINTATAGAITASVDDGVDPITSTVTPANVGKLRLLRNGSGASITVKGTGTANATLGFALVDTTNAGSGTVNDGTTKIGVAAIGSLISAGTLRAALTALETAAGTATAAIAAKVAKAGDTMTGDLEFSGSAKVLYNVGAQRVSRTPIESTSATVWLRNLFGNMKQDVASSGGKLIVYLDPVTGDRMTSVNVLRKFDGTHAVYPPANFPSYIVYKVDGTGALSSLGSLTETPANEAAYQALDEVTIPLTVPETIEEDADYRVVITGEYGANAEAGFEVWTATPIVISQNLPPGL